MAQYFYAEHTDDNAKYDVFQFGALRGRAGKPLIDSHTGLTNLNT